MRLKTTEAHRRRNFQDSTKNEAISCPIVSLDEFLEILARHGCADGGYLRSHWPRFCKTKTLFEAGRKEGSKRLLDIGAHWLHQALLFALDGYAVTAADLPDTIQTDCVIDLARAHDIQLIAYRTLEQPNFAALSDDSFDVILLAEVLEHITFNPVGLWNELYRLLAPGGRIVVTTPNYYGISRRHLREFRHWIGRGTGISVDEILSTPTYGHHWKEYSRYEVEQYFKMLSPDFRICRSLYVEDYLPWPQPKRILARQAIQRFVPFLRSRLHVEVELPRKVHGIVPRPTWD